MDGGELVSISSSGELISASSVVDGWIEGEGEGGELASNSSVAAEVDSMSPKDEGSTESVGCVFWSTSSDGKGLTVSVGFGSRSDAGGNEGV